MLTNPRPLLLSRVLDEIEPMPSSAIVELGVAAGAHAAGHRRGGAPACATTLRSASCAIRYRQSAASASVDVEVPSELKVTAHGVLTAATSVQ